MPKPCSPADKAKAVKQHERRETPSTEARMHPTPFLRQAVAKSLRKGSYKEADRD